jgi:hypothetical protein
MPRRSAASVPPPRALAASQRGLSGMPGSISAKNSAGSAATPSFARQAISAGKTASNQLLQ